MLVLRGTGLGKVGADIRAAIGNRDYIKYCIQCWLDTKS